MQGSRVQEAGKQGAGSRKQGAGSRGLKEAGLQPGYSRLKEPNTAGIQQTLKGGIQPACRRSTQPAYSRLTAGLQRTNDSILRILRILYITYTTYTTYTIYTPGYSRLTAGSQPAYSGIRLPAGSSLLPASCRELREAGFQPAFSRLPLDCYPAPCFLHPASLQGA